MCETAPFSERGMVHSFRERDIDSRNYFRAGN
jgi:hypothetical protein